VETNIVRIEHPEPAQLVSHLEGAGVLGLAGSATSVRLVTHPDVDDADIGRAVAALRSAP
jgi:threonine aldolase